MVNENPMDIPSILTSVKKVLQIPEDYTEYDYDVLMHINSALGDIADLGIGPLDGFMISGEEETWDQFIGHEARYQGVKTLVFLKVRLIFDPPQSGYAITAMEKQIDQQVWRLSMRRESTDWRNPDPNQDWSVVDEIDGGTP